MTSQKEKSNDSEKRLMGLALMIKEIYMPSLESKGDVKHQMGKFVNQIKTSITQAYGNVTINVPELPPNMNADEISRDPNLTEELSNAVDEWTQTIKDTIAKENKRMAEMVHDSASGETEFWQARSATFNMLYQQLNSQQAKNIIKILSARESDNVAVNSFKTQQKEFSKLHAQAKDFVKFLTTLERQFKNIAKGDLKSIEETLHSLLNGLKLIWTISRHINQNEERMEDILEAISNEICKKVREKIDIKTIFKAQKPQKASALIQEGINVLEKWHREFNQTKQEIENQSTIRRWEFTRMKEIFAKPKHMKYILEDLNTACIVLKEFYAILGKDLKAVTGSSDQIEQVLDRVKEQVRKLENFPHDVFNQAYYDEWKATFSGFDTAIINIEQETVQLISHTFNKKLNSSEGAFNLLAKFKNVQTRPKILAEFSNKYDNVLGRYNDELKEMEDLYKTLKVNPPIPKNMPPDSGSIAWSRSIITRIKTPIDKFKQKPEILSKNQPGIQAAKDYVRIAKELTEVYEKQIFDNWHSANTKSAVAMLKENILKPINSKDTDAKQYKVNFDARLKVIIREAKFLDRIGKEIPHTIINIALQEKDYTRHIDRLNKLLRDYNQALTNLRPVEKKLLKKAINSLVKQMDKGVHNHNWFSLSITEYIQECEVKIVEFKEIKDRVLQQALNIENKVLNIENAVLIRDIDFADNEPMDISRFMEYFDTYRNKLLAELVKDYQNIGDIYLKSIEETTCKQKEVHKKNEDMAPYYQYWEKRIFNAITKMIIRAMASNKALWQQRDKLMIKMQADYNHPDMTYHPSTDELNTTLTKFSKNILESSKKFGRWWDGFCRIFEESIDKETSEKTIRYTFYTEINKNPVIRMLSYDIVKMSKDIVDKFDLYKERYVNNSAKRLFDKNELSKMNKQIEKSQNIKDIEERIIKFQKSRSSQNDLSKSLVQNFFIQIDYTEVLAKLQEKCDVWLECLGKVLTDISTRELNAIQKKITDYQNQLGLKMEESGGIQHIKMLLNVIQSIRDETMDMELRIIECQEQFRLRKMYNFPVEQAEMDHVNSLGQLWDQLVEDSNKKDFELISYKQSYARQTQENVEDFKLEIKKAYETYVASGPGAEGVELAKGVQLLEDSKNLCEAFNKTKEEYVLSEQLFNLEISKYPELIKMEEDNRKYTLIYDIYKMHEEAVKEWSMVPWSKLDSSVLEVGANKHEKEVKVLASKKLPNADTYPPFVKLKAKITGFKNSLPLIQELKHPAVQERHWKRIMEESGRDLGDINLKTITLAKVFEMNLHEVSEKVTEICNEAKEEAKNEENIAKIDALWKNTNFTVKDYKKKSYAITATDEIRQLLEDNILILQGVGASKFSRSIKPKVTQWEHDLNLISDVIDCWMLVQRKWQYLESIFSSEDIRTQLPEEAKKFGKTDVNYKKIMEQVHKSPNVLMCCVRSEGGNRLNELKGISNELDKCQKNLTTYLDGKRNIFPRFYFISEEDLLQILGTSEPKAILPHLLKLFDNCKALSFGQGNKIITAMTSDEGESYPFETPVKPDGQVEDWMNKVDDEMKKTLHVIAKRAVFYYAKEDRIDWVKQQLGMIALVGTQIWWTFSVEDVFRRVASGDKHAMKNELAKESQDLNNLIALVRTDLENKLRKSVNTLIILDVHARDIVERFVRDSILTAKEFDWESQLRFYWDLSKDDIRIRQCTGEFDYSYEYQGLNGRLVITPLTDRCVMTLTTSLTFKMGGAPAGPAGTGKTETVKDLAKSMALRCVVTNCGETLDYIAMGVIFSGLIQTGFWGCFDEFNRINVEVLSVVSAQIKTVQNGLIANKPKISFLDNEVRLVPTIGIFITMNPGYAGRSELPDNLKALFRPVTMVVPDLLLICENMLMSEGFTSAKILAKKMTVLYKLAREQLSKQYHYDFGLRALKSVLVMAGQLKRTFADLPEEIVLMRALRDMNMPKFVYDDVLLFKGLINDLFPGLTAERVGYEDLKEKIVEQLENNGLRNDEEVFAEQINKIIQLFETMQTRHTTMVVGPTGAGKSVIINTLAASLKEETEIPTKIDTINAKMITLKELYGVLDQASRDWTDGLLSKIFKDANQPEGPDRKPERRWIVYDGDVDAVWVEDMNSVMDDNRILTLTNGDRIRLQKHCSMLFEVFDLQYASPATISRCGMVYVDPKNLGYKPYYFKWMAEKDKIYKSEILADSLKDLYQKYIPAVMDRIYEGLNGEDIVEPLQFITPRTNLNLVQQLCNLIDAILPEPDANPPPPQEFSDLEKLFLFCLIWSAGGALVKEDRDKFNTFISQTSQILLPHNLYDNCYEIKIMGLDSWEKKVLDYQPPSDGKFSSILVPTVDTTRYSWLLNVLIQKKQPVMFCGDSGSAKTVTVFSSFRQLDQEKYVFLNINFSSRTSSLDFQKIIEENIEKKSLKNYGPKAVGKKMIMFVDDLNMPKIDKYGTQQPNALLKFLVERNQLYQRGGDLELRDIIDVQYIACVSPPGGGNNPVDPRLMSLYNTFNVTFPSREATQKIYSVILSKHLQEFSEDVQGAVDHITQATLSLYMTCLERLPRTPVKFHYIFNLRDLSRVYEGLFLATRDKVQTKGKLVRQWRNECMRVFSDRLINETDRNLVNNEIIPQLVKQFFGESFEDVMRDPIIFGDYALADPTFDEAEDPRLYEDLGDYAQVREKMDKLLEDYNYENKSMNLVLFNDALEHLTKIHRIIRFPRGCGLLVGYGGSGKQSLTRLATFVAGYSIFTINLKRNYREEDFRIDLQTLYKSVLKQPHTFMFTDAHVAEEGFLELINNILTIGMVPALFPEEEKDGLMRPLDDEIRKKKLPETKEFRWQYFVNACRENIHIVLCMSPAGDTLRVRCRNFPGLVSNTNIDWFFPWPEDALADVANYFLKEVDISSDLKPLITDHIVLIHQSVQKYSVDFENIYKRKNYSTPKNYLDFIENYTMFLKDKRKMLDSAVRRLEGGLTTLAKASEDTQVLSEELAVKNAEIAEKKAIVEELIADINQKTEIADKQAKFAEDQRATLAVQNIEIAREEKEATEALEAAAPALAAAQEALKNISNKDLSEVKSMAKPAEAIVLVCQMTFHFMFKDGKDDSWAAIKSRLLSNMKLLDDLKTYEIYKCKHEQAMRAKKIHSEIRKVAKNEGSDDVQAVVTVKSKAAGGLYAWCSSTDKCYDIYKEVEPKRKKAQLMTQKKEAAERELKEVEEQLAELNASLAVLNSEKEEKVGKLNELEAQSQMLARKLNAASKLISGLGSERTRWTADMENFKEDKVKLVGDCLTASSFLSYSGPFNYVLRQKMIFEHWKQDLIEKNIPNKENFKLELFLTDDVEMSRWASEGLPTDELSIQNGILTNNSSRWPLCIDPQMQAVAWIKEKEKKNQFVVLSFNSDKYIKLLEMAVKFGQSVLFEAIDTEIDPMIDPILEKNIVTEAGVEVVYLGDQRLEYHQDFKMLMTTKIANPNYPPEIFGKTSIINFNVTLMGLRDQLLNEVVGYERPELEAKRKQLIMETSANKAELKILEDTLLSELSKETDVPLVDNEPLIEVLENAKTKSVKIANDLENAKITSEDIEQNRLSYQGVAKRGAILFFALTGLSAISKMYEYSLSSYLIVFKRALETSMKDNVLQARLRSITEKLTQLVYEFTCMGIFEKHKLMFSFQMTTMIMDGDDELNKDEMDFFLKGNTSLESTEKAPYKWISKNGWKDALRLNAMGGVWQGICEKIKDNEPAWKRWYDLEAPEKSPIPCGFAETLNKFQYLLVCRILRPDRVVNAIKQFILDRMGEQYVKSPPLIYEKVYAQSSEKTPIVFVLSPGADPQGEVQRLLEVTGVGMSKFKFQALGQGMEQTAKTMIETGAIRGYWVMLQNCHLLTSWLKQLEAIIESLSKPDKGFRLWLTTAPTDKFPLGILQRSLKVVTEPPDGLAANVKQNYTKLSDEMLDECPKQEFRSLVYVLSFFHATIQERKKFGKIGWNVNYDFNDSDFRISFRLISLYLNKAISLGEEEIPWDTLRYLIGEAMYGGRVTDNWDRRVLATYLHEYMGEFIFDSNQKFYFSTADYDYVIPENQENLEAINSFIDQIPIFTSPHVFGLHANAEIQYFTNSAKELWINTLEMQTNDAAASGAVNREEFISNTATEIQEKLPEQFDIYNIKKKFDTPSPTQVVLLQELERFNKLQEVIAQTLFDLKRALIGEIGMSQQLEDLSNSIFNGFVPADWLRKAPKSLKNLVNWIEHFDRRYRQYKEWDEVEEPKVIWLSGLHIPESYLTALVQTTCRAKQWALDKSTLYTVVTKERNPEAIKKRLEHGTYIQGLYLEGAKWSITKDCLDYQNPKELIQEMPLVQIIPVEANKLKLRGTIKTPVYVTQDRKNAMGEGLVFEADLKTDKHVSHWILQGVALVLNTD